MVRYLWLRKRPKKIKKRSPWNDNIRFGNIKNTTVLTSSTLFRELIVEMLDSSDYPLLRQEDDVFFDSATDIIEDDEIFFDAIDDNNFSDPPPLKKHSSPKKSPVIRRSKRVKKKNTRLNKEEWILTTPSKKSKNPLKPIVEIVSSGMIYNEMGFKFAKKFNSKYFTGTVTQINEGNSNDITRKVVYNDGDEENLSLLQIRALKKNSKYIDNITFNESIECDDVGFHFRKKFKNHGFFIGSVSEILHRKNKNRRVLYCDGEEEDLSL